MNIKIQLWINVIFLGAVLLVGCAAPQSTTISGFVVGENGPVSGAVVRYQTTEYYAVTDSEGVFRLEVPVEEDDSYHLTGWAKGYFCVGPVEASGGDEDVEIHLHAHTSVDNKDYAWLPSEYHAGQGENQGCAECHSNEGTEIDFTLPVDEWRLDAHSQSAINPRFLTMYNGTDTDGNQSPDTRYSFSRDYGSFPLPPNLSDPYYGPGYKLDFPTTAGNCASCHTPAAAIDDPYSANPNSLSGVAAEGIPCDFCHKVWDVILEPDTGMPFPNMPGTLSYKFLRPPEGHQFFAGPFDDVAPGEDTLSPIQTQSQYCAPCHFGVFWDTVIYNSFGEWLQSPYSDPNNGQTCQDCHMPRLGVMHFARPDQGGLERDPTTIFSHRMPGALDEELLRNSSTMEVSASRVGDTIVVQVDITNDNTGHHIPTDSPLRQLILLVAATSEDGKPLVQIDGPTLPQWTGIGDAGKGYYAGLPGEAYAKILEELWTEVSPSGAYWNPTKIVSDNRIAAFEVASSTYTFSAPDSVSVQIEVTLLFRRAFIELMDWKGWDVPDIKISSQSIIIE